MFIIPKQFVNPPCGFECNCLFPQCLDYSHFVTESTTTDCEDLEEVFECSYLPVNKNEN